MNRSSRRGSSIREVQGEAEGEGAAKGQKEGNGCWNQISNNVKQTHTHTHIHKFWQVVFPLAQEKKKPRKTVKIVGVGRGGEVQKGRGRKKSGRSNRQTDKSVC